jgi:hypothetical protein
MGEQRICGCKFATSPSRAPAANTGRQNHGKRFTAKPETGKGEEAKKEEKTGRCTGTSSALSGVLERFLEVIHKV